MYVEEDEKKVYLEVPEAQRILGLSRNQIYSISEDEIPSRPDPRNHTRNLFEAGNLFRARKDIEENGSVGDKNFRKYEEDLSYQEDPIVRSAINKMYRNNYDFDKLPFNLTPLAHNKTKVDSDMNIEDKDGFDHVKDRCFGWADESKEECTEHCLFFKECKRERFNTLKDFADKFEVEKTKDDILREIEEKEQEVEDLYNEVEQDLEDLIDKM